MALNATKEPTSGSGKKMEAIESGNYIGRLVQVLDLGLQPQRPYQGQEKPPAHEIMLTYELGTEFLKDEEGNDQKDKPRFISESLPLRNISQDLAKSTKRASVFDPKGVFQGDFSQMVNATCTITIVQNPKRGDPSIVYNNIANVTPPMKGFPVPELVNAPKVLDLDAPDLEVFCSLPDWVQTKIKENLEYNGSVLQRLLEGVGKSAPKQEAPVAAPTEGEEGEGDPWE